jgi:hypothetical protein
MQTMLCRIDSYRYERWIVHCASTGTLTLETNMTGKETVQPVSLGSLPKQHIADATRWNFKRFDWNQTLPT